MLDKERLNNLSDDIWKGAIKLRGTHGRAYFEIMGKKTTNLASINSTKVNLFPVPLPPVAEQAQIVQWVQQ